MARIEHSPTFIEFDERVRVESGPALKTIKATEKLLASGKLASHYQIGGFDALGRVIVAGDEMAYLDWLGDHGWYVYRLEADWVEKGFFLAQAEAEEFAASLL